MHAPGLDPRRAKEVHERRMRLGAALEVDPAKVRLSCSRLDELGSRGEICPAADPIDLQRGAADLLLPGRVQVAQLTDELLALEQTVEVLVPLS